MPKRTLAIVNPHSAGGATGRRSLRIASELQKALGPLDVEVTRGPRDAERLAREAVRAGFERIVVAGGDGTLSEVATGLLSAGLADQAELGILPLASGGDLARTLGIPRGLEGALAVLRAGRTRRLDAGRARYATREGVERTSYFLNAASAGVSGLVARLVNQGGKRLGGRAAFLMGTLRGLALYRPAPCRVRVDGERVHEGPLVLATASNGRYFGAGMQAAPRALPDDGLFDVLILADVSKLRLLFHLPRLYRGTHLSVSGVSSFRGRLVEIEACAAGAGPGAGLVVPIELDGEPLGILPARFELLPGAVSVLAASP